MLFQPESSRTQGGHALPVLPLLCAVLTVLVMLGACATPRRGSGMGTDYFERDFRCSSSPPGQETHARYQQFYAEVRKRFAADTAVRKRSAVVLTGDSTAMLFTEDLLRRELQGIDIVNRGIGGDTSRMLLARISDVSALSPRVVIVAIGGNDLLGGRCITEILDNTRKLVQQLRSGGARVILVSVPPVLTWKANSIVPYYNYRLRQLAGELPGVSYMDLWGELSDLDYPQLKREYVRPVPGKKKPDAVHFNEAAYAAWARLIKRALSAQN